MTASFAEQLARWGPTPTESTATVEPSPPPTTAEARAYCRGLARAHYENFPVVSWMLPRRLHQHFYNVYAYCRWADDLADEVASTEQSRELLAWWGEELAACYQGRATHPVFIALRETIAACEIPIDPFRDLISAFEQDQHVFEYETYAQLLDYCRRSANPVGRLVLFICGEHRAELLPMSDAICTGLQLANFWQDVARDSRIGRCYLPREDRDAFGYTDAELRGRVTNDAFVRLMEFEVGRARELLESGLPLADALPGRLQVDIELFARGGLCILDRIAAIGYRVWDERPVVSKGDVARLLLTVSGRRLKAVVRRR